MQTVHWLTILIALVAVSLAAGTLGLMIGYRLGTRQPPTGPTGPTDTSPWRAGSIADANARASATIRDRDERGERGERDDHR